MPQRTQTAANVAEYTVTELSSAIKRTMEDTFGYVRLRGEISGYRGPHSSGHAYFALKDDRAKIEAVVWKTAFSALAFKPEEGLEVIATGKVSTFPGTSKYQIVIEAMEPAGAGALMALLEERKKKLAAEGLFDEDRKKPLPFLPQVIGIITSPTGAVIRDMMHGFTERFPSCVLVWPVRVQGETCAAEVAAAIRGFNTLGPGSKVPRPDLIIVARGGGSIEDLWGFNEEIVVRAAAGSAIPLISAVGHETDWTLIDLAADARAPTPTKAAEWAVPKYSDLMARMAEVSARLEICTRRQLEAKRTALKGLARGLPRLTDLVAMPRQRFDACSSRLDRSISAYAAATRSRLHVYASRLQPRLLSVRVERCSAFVDKLGDQLHKCFRHGVQKRHTGFIRVSARLRADMLRHPAARGRDQMDNLLSRAMRALDRLVDRRRRALDARAQLLSSLSYKNVLDRGFAVVRDGSGLMIRRADAAAKAGLLEIEFADGRIPAHTGSAPATSRLRDAAEKPSQGAADSRKRQGNLF